MKGLLKDQYPEIAAEFDSSKTIDFTLSNLSSRNPKKVWWLCKEEKHSYEAAPAARTTIKTGRKAGTGCPYCTGKKVLEGYNDLSTLEPKVASTWHPTKNYPLTPQKVGRGFGKKVWWQCKKGHDWESNIFTRSQGGNCPYCSGNTILQGFNDLQTVRPDIAAEWHPTKNGELTPQQIGSNNTHKVWWLGKCGHEWDAAVTSRFLGKGCPICTNKRCVIGLNDLATLFPLVALQWHSIKNDDLTPQKVTPGYTTSVWWECDNGHEWQTTPSHRTQRGQGCPKCSNRVSQLEKDLFEFVESLNVSPVQSDRSILPNNKEIDIYIPSHKLGIEFNGIYWHTESAGKGKTYHYDKYKDAQKAGITLIQIWEDDWNKKSDLIKKMVQHKLGLSNDNKVYARDTQIVEVNTKAAKEFLEANHIQGFTACSIYLSLQKDGNVVALMGLGKDKSSLIINRYATSKHVVGGFSKLLNYVENNYEYDKLITYSDNTISNGALYENNGFIIDKEMKPQYMLVKSGEKFHKRNYDINKFKTSPNLEYKPGYSIDELALLNRFDRIWDAGKLRWFKAK